MIRRWSVPVLLALLVVFATAHAADVEKPTDAELRKKIDELTRELEKQKAITEALRDITDLKQRLATLEQRFDAMQKERQARISRAFPDTGMIRLENRLSVPATIILNGTPYRLNAFQTRELASHPAGTFTFEALVDGFGSLNSQSTRVLQPNQVFTIFTYLP